MSGKINKLCAAAAICIGMFIGGAHRIPAAEIPHGDDIRSVKEVTDTARTGQENTAVPAAPEKVAQEKVTYNSVTLNWSSVEGAFGYQISYVQKDGADTVAGTTTADVLSYKCKGLTTGTQYEFRVCALDENGRAGECASVEATPYLNKTKFTSVSTPQLKKAVLEWKKVAGAMKYELYRKTAAQESYELLAVTADTAYTDETVTAGESYSYQVRAIRDENGVTVQAKFSEPAAVGLSSAAMQFESCEAVNYSSVKLTWRQDPTAAGYYIYRSVKENGTYRKIKTITDRAVLNYTDSKIVPGKKFFYKICTYTKKGQTVTAGEQSQAVRVQTQADGPQLVAVRTNVSNRSLSLEWKKAANTSGYRIYRSVYPDKGFAKIKDINGGTFVGYEDRSVIPGGTYYYRIKGIYVNGSYKGLSSPSQSLEGTLTPCAPIGLVMEQTAADTLQVSWNLSIGATGYRLYRSDAAGKDFKCIAQGLTETTYTDSGLRDGQTYSYRVSAVGPAGEGLKCHAVSYTVGGVSLNTRTLKLCVGATKPLKASTFLEGDVEWSCSNTDIAQVDEEGNVTGIAYGTVRVTAAVDGQSASATVSVTPGNKNGIDVSRWQEDIDWRRVKESGVEFAFLRISNHNLADYTFETKYQNAFSVGMPMGVYCYSRAKTVAEAQEEARVVLEILDGRKLDYPIAFDLEDAVHKASTMKKETLHQMIDAFKQVVEDAGYRFVLYSYVTFLNTYLDRTKLDGIDLWVARYRNLSLGTGYTGTGNIKYWQYNSGQYNGSNAQVDGITKETGELVSVDVNIEYEN
ncbi:hypothetical protein C823_006438 [Eubacterium plexicaudatum ASF492]|uniref:Fibronectin type-III domain-containing protein n=1 Tax=Eubacterium plexicaudatum ASF492 TaxID=1235802 RepID=N2ADL3_9FIRM|nr:hypothetical protein C823_006438 [Eubacterium plexicaudatum ASF492]